MTRPGLADIIAFIWQCGYGQAVTDIKSTDHGIVGALTVPQSSGRQTAASAPPGLAAAPTPSNCGTCGGATGATGEWHEHTD